jgi:hypothetical protein
MNYLPGLALNHSLPDLCLLSSQDYRREPLVPGRSSVLIAWCLCSASTGQATDDGFPVVTQRHEQRQLHVTCILTQDKLDP